MAYQASSNSKKGTNVIVEEVDKIDLPCRVTQNVEGNIKTRVIVMNDERQLEFVFNLGLVKDFALSMPIRLHLRRDKWNLFLPVPQVEEILLGFLKEDEDVREGFEVNVYDKGGHEFQAMMKKWGLKESNKSFYVLNRGWNSFCAIRSLKKNDLIALRTFRNAFTDKLSFLVTYKRMK